jgi:transketolase
MGDGELNEGSNWESVMLAGKEKLHNLIAIIDRNNIQIDGYTEDVMPMESMRAKWEAFNWHVLEVDGHNIQEFIAAIDQAKAIFEKPSVIIAHTIPGKGVHEFEKKFEWHGKPPNKEEADMALRELRTLGGQIRAEHE